MKEGYDLIVTSKGVEKSFVDDFESGMTEISRPSYETKDIPKNDWNGENGEEVLFPEDGLKSKGADFSVKLCYAGGYRTWDSIYHAIVMFLSSGLLDVCDTYNNRMYQPCFFKGLSDEDVYSSPDVGDVVEYTLNFHVIKL